MKLLLFTLCLCLFSARFDETSGTQGNRIANELVQKPFTDLNPKIVKEVRMTFMYGADSRKLKYRTIYITKWPEIIALVHAFRTSTRDKHVADEPIAVPEHGDMFMFNLKGHKDSIYFGVYPDDEIERLWGHEIARLQRHYRKLSAHAKATQDEP